MAKIQFYNDSGKEIRIHPGTKVHGIVVDMNPIKHGEVRVFESPDKDDVITIKQWSDGEILVTSNF